MVSLERKLLGSYPPGKFLFVEHSHDIFPEYLEKVPYEIPRNIPKQCSMNILQMLHAFFQVDQEMQ